MTGPTVAFVLTMLRLASQMSGLPEPPAPLIVFDHKVKQWEAYADPGVVHLDPHWRQDKLMDQSILLHELVHIAQFSAGVQFQCLAERERLAYAVQAVFLAQHGVDFWKDHPPTWLAKLEECR